MNVIKGKESYKPMIAVLISVSIIKVNYSWEGTQRSGAAKSP